MEGDEIYLRGSIKEIQTPIEDHYSIFLNRYSTELKFMGPWAQYDDDYSEDNIYSSKQQQQNNFVNKSRKKKEKDDAEIKKEESDEKYFLGLEKHPL